jgi:hypothetical protein
MCRTGFATSVFNFRIAEVFALDGDFGMNSVTPTIVSDQPLPNIQANNYGDPLSRLGIASNGIGSGGGIGSGVGGGVGPGRGPGVGPGTGADSEARPFALAAASPRPYPFISLSLNTPKKRGRPNGRARCCYR